MFFWVDGIEGSYLEAARSLSGINHVQAILFKSFIQKRFTNLASGCICIGVRGVTCACVYVRGMCNCSESS